MKRKFTTVTLPIRIKDELMRIAKENHRSMAGQVAVFVEREKKVLDKNRKRTY